MAHGYADGIDPTAFAIVNGKLYLNLTHSIHAAWLRRAAGSIKSGDKVWASLGPRLAQKKGYWND